MDAGWRACRGALVVHALWRAECTEDQCEAPELTAHDFVLDCDAVGCECAQPIGSGADLASSGPFLRSAVGSG
ncbi:MAG: hypothetical protein WBB07_16915 [Mycobacterium sp.]